ncbi:DUF6457 domain-containing protein [Rhizohabitans arisaemae]|uniref:DUF6457 domain-containing protein n=1 Tax=Rhizohabitans arisaemae TaxID=2720610 RepID=UPI0024B1BA2F|nr:DUF6457 domain-containing protein [Rhizohabitans arisaemae]
MDELDEWTALVCRELGLDPDEADLAEILELTREVAHGVERRAAPWTVYLLGLAQGRGSAPTDAVDRLTDLARGREPQHG